MVFQCHEWFKRSLVPDLACHFSLNLSPQHRQLTFTISVNKPPTLAVCDCLETNAFTEGLWTGDCGELFLSNPSSGYYVEVNLSPRGGWWNCAFSAPHVRVMDPPAPFAGVITSSSREADGGWIASITIPLDSLPAELQFDHEITTGNVCFCLHDLHNTTTPPLFTSESSEVFFTYQNLQDNVNLSPNFHLPHKFHGINEFLVVGEVVCEIARPCE